MNLHGRFEIFGQMCLKHGTPDTFSVLLAYIEATVARGILYLLRLQERCEFSLFMSCINLVQANFGNALMCYFSFSKHTFLYKF